MHDDELLTAIPIPPAQEGVCIRRCVSEFTRVGCVTIGDVRERYRSLQSRGEVVVGYKCWRRFETAIGGWHARSARKERLHETAGARITYPPQTISLIVYDIRHCLPAEGSEVLVWHSKGIDRGARHSDGWRPASGEGLLDGVRLWSDLPR